jgi:3-oxoadipyl-CoA thiolase
MADVFICDYVRTPIGRYAGDLSSLRADDLAALPIKAILARNPSLDPALIEEVWLGCANQAGEDNRNVARMALLLAGLPQTVPGVTVNRLCASGLEAVISAARAIASDDMDLALAGGVESMSRAPFVMPKATSGFSRQAEIYDTTIGWRFINPLMQKAYGTDSMPETAENLVDDYKITRADQDAFALRSQSRAAAAQANGRLAQEIITVEVAQGRGQIITISKDEHPRSTTIESLNKLRPIVRADGTITAGNASGVNDGAAILILASSSAIRKHGLMPKARIMGAASAGVAPRIMGYGPVPASQKLLNKQGLTIKDLAQIEINEAFAAQVLACTRAFGMADDDERLNPNGGAIALGHPLGMSGARLAGTLALELAHGNGRYGLASMCVGVGQGAALLLEKI